MMSIVTLWSQAAPAITPDNITWLFRLLITLLIAVTAFFLKRGASVQDKCISDLSQLEKSMQAAIADHETRIRLVELLAQQHDAAIERVELGQLVRERKTDTAGGNR